MHSIIVKRLFSRLQRVKWSTLLRDIIDTATQSHIHKTKKLLSFKYQHLTPLIFFLIFNWRETNWRKRKTTEIRAETLNIEKDNVRTT